MTSGNRYKDLLTLLPNRSPYASSGTVLPYLDAPQVFNFKTASPNTLWNVSYNDVPAASITTDSNGVANVYSIPRLPVGDYEIKIVNPLTNETHRYYASIRTNATFYAMYADVLNALDAEISEMDAARSLENVTSTYIGQTFGQLVRQPFPTTYQIEEYRNLLRILRPAYRHFGGHPFGVEQAVMGSTSVNPFLVPKAWRPTWRLGSQVTYNGDLQKRSRVSTAMFGPTGAVTGSYSPELPNLNRQATYWVLPSIAPSSTVTSGFRQPPTSQVLTVTLASNGQSMTIVGLDDTGTPYSEIVPDPSVTPIAGTYDTQSAFSKVTSISLSGAGGNGRVGINDGAFVKIIGLGSYNRNGSSPSLAYLGIFGGRPRFTWGSGSSVDVNLVTVTSPVPQTTKSLIFDGMSTVTLNDVHADFDVDMIGQNVTIMNEMFLSNNGTFVILDVVPRESLTFRNPIGRNATSNFSWSIQTAKGSGTAYDVLRTATAIATFESSGTYELNPTGGSNVELLHDRLGIDIDNKGTVFVYLGPADSMVTTITVAEARDRINAAFTADTRYGNGSAYSVASLLVGTQGDNNTVLVIKSMTPGPHGSVCIRPVPCDANPNTLSLSRSITRLSFVPSGNTITCASTAQMPSTPFQVKIRGLRFPLASGNIVETTGINPTLASCNLTGYTFTQADVGGYVRWHDTTGGNPNDGLHEIVSLDLSNPGNCIIQHENSFTGDLSSEAVSPFFSTGGGVSGTGTVYHPGEVRSVTSNNKGTGVLTLDQAPLAWQVGAIVEDLSAAEYTVTGTNGLGSVDFDVNMKYRPFYDIGDSISHVSGTTWRITSARGNFASVSPSQNVVINNAQNLENEGPFPIISGTTTTLDFTNAEGVAETSQFSWEIVPTPATVTDTVNIVGSDTPDTWLVTSSGTTVTTCNDDPTASDLTPGLMVPSRLVLSSNSSIVLEKFIPEALQYRGLPLDYVYWLQEHATSGSTYTVEVSYDGGTTWFTSQNFTADVATVLASTDSGTQFSGPQNPFSIKGRFFVPHDATACVIRITRI